jgi:hypothetical protein
VDNPAIEKNFMHFNQMQEFKKFNDEKRMVYGPAMIPNKNILRVDDSGNEFYVRFPEKVVEQMAHRFMMQNHQHDATVQHEYSVEGVTVVESWLKAGTHDKSIELGFEDMPNNTWFIGQHVADDATWQKVKTGELRGFSIETTMKLVETKMQSVIDAALHELEEILKSK